MTEIMDQLFALCDALPSVGPSQAIVDCDRIPKMPDITFSLSDADLTLSAEQYVLRVSRSKQRVSVYSWPTACCLNSFMHSSILCVSCCAITSRMLCHLSLPIDDMPSCDRRSRCRTRSSASAASW